MDLRNAVLVPFEVIRARAPVRDVTAGEDQDPRARGHPWRWGRARRGSPGAAQRAVVCTSMARDALSTIAPRLPAHALPRCTLLGIRPSERARPHTAPVPSRALEVEKAGCPSGAPWARSLSGLARDMVHGTLV